LHDPENTYVIAETAAGLLGRRDVSGLRLVAKAVAQGDETTRNWLEDALNDECMQTREDWDTTLELLRLVSEDEDEVVRRGAEAMHLLFVER
jgi:hypothetical protein